MIARQLVTYSLPTLSINDTGQDALELMEEFKVSHLPLVDNGQYINLISEEVILDKQLEQIELGKAHLDFFRPFVIENQTVFDILNVLAKMKVSVLPVLDTNEQYIGSILINDLLFKIIELFGLNQEGAVLVFRLKKQDYSIVQIGQIIEANNAKILSFFIVPEDETYLRLIVKVNTRDVVSLIQTFERYDYEVESVLFDDKKYEQLYEERLEALLKFLSI
jgi:CBS domain-containing protein